MSNTGEQGDIHQHSGWWLPLSVLLVILLLSGLFLGWYLRPGLKPVGAPTGQSNMVNLTVRGSAFAIPANYIEKPAARAGGGDQRFQPALAGISFLAQWPFW